MKGRALFGLSRYDDAVEVQEERLRQRPTSDMRRVFLAATMGHLGRAKEASRRWVEAKELNPNFSMDHLRQTFVYTSPDVMDRFAQGLVLAGVSV